MTIDRLTKLTVRSVWPEKSPLPEGLPEFTAQDINMGVAHCNAIGGAILLHKYVFNKVTQSQCPGFYREVWGLAIQTALDRRWDDGPPGGMWYRKLAHAALYEILSPALNCPQCKGAKFIGNRACPACGASGRISVESAHRAEALGIPAHNWEHGKPPWKTRYETIYRELASREGSAERELALMLSDERHSGADER